MCEVIFFWWMVRCHFPPSGKPSSFNLFPSINVLSMSMRRLMYDGQVRQDPIEVRHSSCITLRVSLFNLPKSIPTIGEGGHDWHRRINIWIYSGDCRPRSMYTERKLAAEAWQDEPFCDNGLYHLLHLTVYNHTVSDMSKQAMVRRTPTNRDKQLSN